MKPLDQEDLELLQLAKDAKCSFAVQDPHHPEQLADITAIEARLSRLNAMGYVSRVYSVPNHQSRHRGYLQVFIRGILPMGDDALRRHDASALMNEIGDPVRGRLTVDHKQALRALDDRLESIAGDHVGRGTLSSGMYLNDCAVAIRSALESFAQCAVDRWVKTAHESGFALTSAAKDRIGAELRLQLSKLHAEGQARYAQAHATAGGLGSPELSPAADEFLQEANNLLAYGWLHPTGSVAAPTTAIVDRSVTVHGAVGAVQTGDSATAYVAQSMQLNLSQLQDLLEQLLQPSIQLDDTLRAMVEEALQESRGPNPNQTRIRVLASGVAGTIQTLGAIPAAVELGKAILALLGVHLD